MTWLSLTRVTGGIVYLNMDNVAEFEAAPDTAQTLITTTGAGIDGGPLTLTVTESPEAIAKRLLIYGGKSPE